ncbi:MAG: histidine kinase N-terminal 7TM domain-containing protein [Oscillospiraceae bacterium]|nr:histidine kinase N-terminal 7TM domain-containing protein [Oscillospiraceae bacterium]
MNIVLAFIHIFSVITMGVSIVWLALKANKNKLTYSFITCQSLIILWSVSKLAELQAADNIQLYICYLIGNISVCFIGTAWVVFSVRYRSHKCGKKTIMILNCISLINYAAVVSNPLHGMYYQTLSVNNIDHGFLFYENVLFTYVCLITGIVNICAKTFGERKYSRGQAVFIAGSVVVPMILNIFFISGKYLNNFDPTPLGFGLSSICVMLAVYRYDFLDVNSITFAGIFSNISEGVIICNEREEVTFINCAAKKLFPSCDNINGVYSVIGDKTFIGSTDVGFAETEITLDGVQLSVKRYNQFGKNNNIVAVAFIINDITKYYELIERTRLLAAANEEVAVEKERNRLAQEVHDTAGHTLTMVNSLAKIIDIRYSDTLGEAAGYVDEIRTVAASGITQLRMAVNNIRNCSYISISNGISELLKGVREIKTELCVQGEETEKFAFCSSAVYASCRETITNCLRYSGADRIDVIIKYLDKFLEVYIFDNGCGCDGIHEGDGLTGITRRIEEIGGKATFASSEGNGFTTILKIPTGGAIDKDYNC